MKKRIRGAEPVNATFLTWEWMTTYEKFPTKLELDHAFESDFPETCANLKSVGGHFTMWPLISFNSPEGRRFRYLVALMNSADDGKVKKLPVQIWLYGAVDEMLKENENLENCDGNCLAYYVEGEVLRVLIFFEGRLCHWIEESGYGMENLVQKRIESLEQFLKQDALFSRTDKFIVQKVDCLTETLKSVYLRRALRDPFWKVEDRSLQVLASVVALCVVMALVIAGNLSSPKTEKIPDVLPPELSEPEPLPLSTEAKAEDLHVDDFNEAAPKVAIAKKENAEMEPSGTVCSDPSIRIQGIVANRLALIDGKNYGKGDSLGVFEIAQIDRGGIHLSCAEPMQEPKDFFVGVR